MENENITLEVRADWQTKERCLISAPKPLEIGDRDMKKPPITYRKYYELCLSVGDAAWLERIATDSKQPLTRAHARIAKLAARRLRFL